MKKLLPFFLLVSTVSLGGTVCFPENKLEIPVDAATDEGISEADFNAVQKELQEIYTPIAAAQGGKLTFISNWKDRTVNAYAQRFGHENEDGEELPPFDDWRVVFLGGLARHKHVTRDGFSLIVCHELGHHFGGAPVFGGELVWASVEGQADYYATSKCLRRLWLTKDNAKAIANQTISETLRKSCLDQWKNADDMNLCLRIGLASQSIGNLFGSLVTFGKLPKFETPDQTVVSKTNNAHPKAQCRLDTYVQGALCEIPYTEDMGSDEITGACHARNGQSIGLRPACWYKAKN